MKIKNALLVLSSFLMTIQPMEAQFLKKLQNKSATMECVGLEKINKKINKSDYKFM